MEEIIYEISELDLNVLKAHYNIDIAYLDQDNIYKVSKVILDRFKSQGYLIDIEDKCQELLSKTFNEVFINDSIKQFIANNSKEIDLKSPFNKFPTFFLTGEAILDKTLGDVLEVKYKKEEVEEVAIHEYRSYKREQFGQIPNDTYKVTKNITVKYFRKDGTFLENILPPKVLNEYERINLDKSARANIIENIREDTGDFINQVVGREVLAGSIPLEVAETFGLATASEFLEMLGQDHISVSITAYREDRRNEPLINALNNYDISNLLSGYLTPSFPIEYLNNINQEILDFIKNKVNVEFYTLVS